MILERRNSEYSSMVFKTSYKTTIKQNDIGGDDDDDCRCNENLNHLKCSYDNNRFVDIVLRIHDTTTKAFKVEILLHKIILLTSEYFKRIFSTSFSESLLKKERKETKYGIMNLDCLNVYIDFGCGITTQDVKLFFELFYENNLHRIDNDKKRYIHKNILMFYHLTSFFQYDSLKSYCEEIFLEYMDVTKFQFLLQYCIHENHKTQNQLQISSSRKGFYIPDDKLSIMRNALTWFRCCYGKTYRKPDFYNVINQSIEKVKKYDPFVPYFKFNKKTNELNVRDSISFCNGCYDKNMGPIKFIFLGSFKEMDLKNSDDKDVSWYVTLRQTPPYDTVDVLLCRRHHTTTNRLQPKTYKCTTSCYQFSKAVNWWLKSVNTKNTTNSDFNSRTELITLNKVPEKLLHNGICKKCKQKKLVNVLCLDINIKK